MVAVVVYNELDAVGAKLAAIRRPFKDSRPITDSRVEAGSRRNRDRVERERVLIEIRGAHGKDKRLADNRNFIADRSKYRGFGRRFRRNHKSAGRSESRLRSAAITVVRHGQSDNRVTAIIFTGRNVKTERSVLIADQSCESRQVQDRVSEQVVVRIRGRDVEIQHLPLLDMNRI